ncbi:hypothetical protein AB0H83_34935 [Dactylosporangium sp. NPDC050688]|uniref:hypothetical protein n=1 Tax=Dactylosporangium sp. NPDC050688 TaxID=3157217 RepID=UPI0033E91161
MFYDSDLPNDGRLGAAEYAEQFPTLLRRAAALVEPPWFRMSIAPIGEDPSQLAYRERVYCYELYHQIRMLSTGEVGRRAGAPRLLLSGELDKYGINSVVPDGRQKPDLVWHEPGESRNNAVIVEVKTVQGLDSPTGMEASLTTLRDFLQAAPHVRYHSGILLVFGNGTKGTVRFGVRKNVKELEWEADAQRRVRVVWHADAGFEPVDLGSLASIMHTGRP